MSETARHYAYIICIGILSMILGITAAYIIIGLRTKNISSLVTPKTPKPTPQIAAWVAWWKEKEAYEMLEKYPHAVTSLSPVWFMLDASGNLTDVGTFDRQKFVDQAIKNNYRLYPTVGSELSGDKLSPLFNNASFTDKAINSIIVSIESLGSPGIDIDLEGIPKKDKEAFTAFLTKLSTKLKQKNLYLSVAIHAQTGHVAWSGTEGQDIQKIGHIADEVRIMLYDEHSADSQPGVISSYSWIKEVAHYNETNIPKNKIVLGIPTYGYIWTKTDTKGYQFDEFNTFLQEKIYNDARDTNSGERAVVSDSFSGWLSDGQAMVLKIRLLQSLGFNKFILWHLGGADNTFFETNWQQ